MWRMRAMKQKVSSAYFSYGLYCATHQIRMIGFSFVTFCIICYPLTRLPFLGSVPSSYLTPVDGHRDHPAAVPVHDNAGTSAPAWWSGAPAAYVQQILVKATVAPWDARKLHALDAFRGPLHKVFDILDTLGYVRYEDNSSSPEPKTVDDVCMRVAEPRRAARRSEATKAALPEYGCLVLSPATLWGGREFDFASDSDLLKTIYADIDGQYETLASAPPLREVLFGVPWRESGVSRYYMRTRQRTIYYAVTLIMRCYNAGLIAALRSRLLDKYPLSMLNYRRNGVDGDYLTHISYGRSESTMLASYIFENLPLIVAYGVLFLYIYFSVQKIEMVKSKWGLALSAVATVVASLLMSFSICVSFGMRPSVSGSDIFPYLVVIVGLENMMVLTRAVASTPLHLEVPIRVAQGLGCEGWNITKYLMTELIVLSAGFFILVPAVQEFCLFAIVGLFVDFFLQMTFFATVLSVDIRRLELEDLNRHRMCSGGSQIDLPSAGKSTGGLSSSKSADLVLPPGNSSFFMDTFFVTPRRIRLMNFVAQKRCMQSGIIITSLAWIVLVIYNAGPIGKFLQSADTQQHEAAAATLRLVAEAARDTALPESVRLMLAPGSMLLPSVGQVLHAAAGSSYFDIGGHSAVADNWERLSFMHWPSIFAFYNISVAGTYLTFLPSIKVSTIVSLDEAMSLRRSFGGTGSIEEEAEDPEGRLGTDRFDHVQGIGEELDEAVHDGDLTSGLMLNMTRLLEPSKLSGLELILFLLLATAAFFVFVYVVAALYRCMCGRTYHEWRPHWFRGDRSRRLSAIRAKWRCHLREGTVVSLEGHKLSIECVVTDGVLAVTTCLGGEIRVWDPATGQNVAVMLRKSSASTEYSRPSSPCSLHNAPAVDGRSDERLRSYSLSSADLTSFIDVDFSGTTLASPQQQLSNAASPSIVMRTPIDNASRSPGYVPDLWHPHPPTDSSSRGGQMFFDGAGSSSKDSLHESGSSSEQLSWPGVWCIALQDGLVAVGCSDGSVELWDATTGALCGTHRSSAMGITVIKLDSCKVLVGRSDGTVDFLEMSHEVFGRRSSFSSFKGGTANTEGWIDEEIRCHSFRSIKAHQGAVHFLEAGAGRVVTAGGGGQDACVLKVYSLEDGCLLHALRGQARSSPEALKLRGPASTAVTAAIISALHIDTSSSPHLTVSGDRIGGVYVWDLLTGQSLHCWNVSRSGAVECDSGIASLVSSLLYVVASTTDGFIYVWNRSNDILQHRIAAAGNGVSHVGLAFFTHRLLVAAEADDAQLHMWDAGSGDVVHSVALPQSAERINHLHVVSKRAILCSCGSRLLILSFPKVREKLE